MDKVTKIFDCHSHWGTKRGYIFRTEAELAQQEKIWKTKATFWSEDEMADYFRRNNARDHPRSLVHEVPADRGDPRAPRLRLRRFSASIPTWCSAIGCSSIRAARSKRSANSTARSPPRPASSGCASTARCSAFPRAIRAGIRSISSSIEADRPIMILTGLTGIGQGLPGGKGIVLDHGHPRHIDEVAARYPQLRILAARPGLSVAGRDAGGARAQAQRQLRAARLGTAAVFAGAEEGDRRPAAGSRHVRLRFSRAALREGDGRLERGRIFARGAGEGAVPQRGSLLCAESWWETP